MLLYDKKDIRLPRIENYMGLFDRLKRSDPKEKYFEDVSQLFQKNNYEDALSLLDKYFDKENARDWHIKAKILEKLENHKQAIACYSKTIQLDSQYYDAWFKLGLDYFRKGDFKSAADAFSRTSIAENPITTTKWNATAEFYYMMSLYMQYLDSHDRQLRQIISEEITKLRTVIPFNEESEDKFLTFCSKNFKDIVKNLQPEGDVDFTVPRDPQ